MQKIHIRIYFSFLTGISVCYLPNFDPVELEVLVQWLGEDVGLVGR